MEQELKYPIKYAVLGLKQSGGLALNYRKVTCGYIASKCYVVESALKYKPDGSSYEAFRVVFPYTNYTLFKKCINKDIQDIGNPVLPIYDANMDKYPCDLVLGVYDTFEEAAREAKLKNGALLNEKISNISVPKSDSTYNEEYEKTERDFYREIMKCKWFESLVLARTRNMEITDVNEPVQLVKKKTHE